MTGVDLLRDLSTFFRALGGVLDGFRERAAAVKALERVAGIGRVHDAAPVTASAPHALVEIDAETDWGHKSGSGREIRLAAILRGEGERLKTDKPKAVAAPVTREAA